MHTYINDPAYTTSTTEGIQRAGEIALARSLNIGRVIAFTGSGLSIEYGRPIWSDLINEYIKLTIDAYEYKVLEDESIITLWKEFILFFKKKDIENKIHEKYRKHYRNYKKITKTNNLNEEKLFFDNIIEILEYLIIDEKIYPKKSISLILKSLIATQQGKNQSEMRNIEQHLESAVLSWKNIRENTTKNNQQKYNSNEHKNSPQIRSQQKIKKLALIIYRRIDFKKYEEIIGKLKKEYENIGNLPINDNDILEVESHLFLKSQRAIFNEILNEIIKNQTSELDEQVLIRNSRAIESLRKKINFNNFGIDDIPDSLRYNNEFIFSLTKLCEEIIAWKNNSNDLAIARRKIARLFSNTNKKIFLKVLLENNNYQFIKNTKNSRKFMQYMKEEMDTGFYRKSPNSSCVKRINGDRSILILMAVIDFINEHDKINHLNDKNENEFIEITEMIKKIKSDFVSFKSSDHLDPLYEVHKKLEINRYLTVNYDIEIERMLAPNFANAKDPTHHDFCNFLNSPEAFDYLNFRIHSQKRKKLKNGMQQAITSSTITDDNLGELFTFGAFPTNFKTSVFHLHGRVDDPDNMVITQSDYERLYLKSSEQRKSFEEARYTVFTGSDILFVGVGMSETDIMAPLRDFASQQKNTSANKGRIYALLHSSIKEDNIYKIENSGNAHRLFKHYGVYTLYIDGADDPRLEENAYRFSNPDDDNYINALEETKIRIARQFINKMIDHINEISIEKIQKNTGNASSKVSRTKLRKQEKQIKDFDRDVISCIRKSDNATELNIALDIYTLFIKKENMLQEENIQKQGDNYRTRITTRLLRKLESRLMSRGLQQKILQLSHANKTWWIDWHERPESRKSIYGSTERSNNDSKPLVWVRHKTSYQHREHYMEDFFDKKNKFIDNQLCQLSEFSQKNNSPDNLRILRVEANTGFGKGSLVNILSSGFPYSEKVETDESHTKIYYPFEYLFEDRFNGSKERYAGGFFVHLTFTLEFTSIIFGLVRFIISVLGKQVKNNALESDKICSSNSDRLYGLVLLNLALEELTQNKSKRIFICLSGLEKLVNESGDAYSPVHREFFRIITYFNSQHKTKPALDLLLISESRKIPIRYLSHECVTPPKEKTKKFIKYGNGGVHLKKWEKLANIAKENLLESAFSNARLMAIECNKCSKNKKIIASINLLEEEEFNVNQYDKNLIEFLQKNILHAYLFFALSHWNFINEDKINADQLNVELQVSANQGGSKGFISCVLKSLREVSLQRIIEEEAFLKENEKKSINDTSSQPGQGTNGQNVKSIKHAVPLNIRDVVMRHLALFNHPVQPSVLLACPDLMSRLKNPPSDYRFNMQPEAILQLTLEQLKNQSLIIEVRPVTSPEGLSEETENAINWKEYRYVLHRKIAQVIAEDMNYVTEYAPESSPYQATWYCEQPLARGTPTKEHYEFVSRLLEGSLRTTGKQWKYDRAGKHSNYAKKIEDLDQVLQSKTQSTQLKQDAVEKIRVDFHEHCAVVRAAYATLRGSFSIGSMSRMDGSENISGDPPYETYRSWIRSITNCAVRLGKFRGILDKKPELKIYTSLDIDFNLPFYRDEVSWLFNERALISFIQGRLFDAIPLYRQALRVIEASQEGVTDQSLISPYRRIQINLALAKIERGDIQYAVNILNSAIDQISLSEHSTKSLTLLYARGYRGLCDHLTGNFTQAEQSYKKTIKEASKIGQLRAVSIFQRHLADLMRIQFKLDEASQLLLLSEKVAEQARQEDILHYSLLARARLMRDLHERREALQILRRAEDYANSMGLDKMMVEALKVRGEIMLSEGEVTQAGRVTAQAVALAKRNGMRLRKISAALVQSQVYKTRGQKEFAEQILDEIIHEAGQLGYTLKSGRAQKLRQELKYQ